MTFEIFYSINCPIIVFTGSKYHAVSCNDFVDGPHPGISSPVKQMACKPAQSTDKMLDLDQFKTGLIISLILQINFHIKRKAWFWHFRVSGF